MDELNFTFKMPDDETLAKYISIKGEKGEKGDPTKLSQLDNDTGFVTANTDALTNYYTKAQTDSSLANKVDNSTLEALEIPSDFFTGDETITGSGTFIELDYTAEAILKDIKLYGDTKQDGTPIPDSPVEIQVVTGDQTIVISDGGQQSQSYTLPLGNLELCKIGNYQDYIYKSANRWRIHKEIAKIVLNGTQTIGYQNSAFTYVAPDIVPATSASDRGTRLVMSDHYLGAGTEYRGNIANNNIAKAIDSYAPRQIAIKDSRYTTVGDLKDWLENNPVTIWYALENPVDEEISNSILIKQLEAISQAKCYDGQSQIIANGEISAILAIVAFKNNWSGTVAGINAGLDDKADKKMAEQKPYYFNSVAEMQAYNLSEGDIVITAGYYSYNDGGAGKYKILDTDLTADNGSVINLTNGLQATLIIENGTINVKQFGAKGDDATDDTIAMQNAINYAQSKGSSIGVDSGTYQVTGLTVSGTLKIIGNGYNSVIKAKSGSTSDIITLTGDGIYKSDISNIFIDGNKENVSAAINGIKLEKGTSSAGDKYTIIHDVTIKNLTGCGIYANENTSGNLRELRFRNVDIGSCEDTGLFLQGVTDSYFDTVVCHTNTKYGFNINSGPHKMVNCKAFYNGAGDGTTIEDVNRIPASAFTVTSDTSPQSGKTYYTRSGTNQQNDWYVFAEFTGDTFDGETTYYELTTSYYKKYAGFYIHGVGFQLSNCESQENFGDGFVLGGTNYVISSCIADNNGNLATSYASAGLEQLYYGFYGGLWQSTLSFTAKNFRNSSVGKQQKAPALLVGCSEVSGNVTGTDQVTSDILFRNCSLASMEFVYNGKPQQFKADLSALTKIPANLTFLSDRSYLVQQNKVNYLHFELKDTDGFATSTTNKQLFAAIPEIFRPSKDLIFEGWLGSSGASGWSLDKGRCTVYLSHAGNIACRASNSAEISDGQVLNIYVTYPVRN